MPWGNRCNTIAPPGSPAAVSGGISLNCRRLYGRGEVPSMRRERVRGCGLSGRIVRDAPRATGPRTENIFPTTTERPRVGVPGCPISHAAFVTRPALFRLSGKVGYNTVFSDAFYQLGIPRGIDRRTGPGTPGTGPGKGHRDAPAALP